MFKRIPYYLRLLFIYQRFVGIKEIECVLRLKLLKKLGVSLTKESTKTLENWFLFQTLSKNSCVEVLSFSKKEARVKYTPQEAESRPVIVALRIPFSDSSDPCVFDQVFVREEYKHALGLLANTYKQEKIATILDVGANIGCASLYFHTLFPTAHIFSLEPEESNYKRLQRNISLNFNSNIIPHRAALATQPGKLQISRDFRDGKEWGARFVKYHDSQDSDMQHADAIDIWGLFEKSGFNKVDLLKIDIEGAEADLLRNSEFKLFIKNKVKRLVIEVHEEFIGVSEVIDILVSLGFQTNTATEFVCGIKLVS